MTTTCIDRSQGTLDLLIPRRPKSSAIALFAFLIGINSLVPMIRLHAEQPLDSLSLEEMRVLAEQGDAAAQVALGVRYFDGEGVPQDDAEAVRWYRLAADQGDAFAQFTLGLT